MASITLKNLTKVYPGDVLAIDDVSLDIEDKEFIVLVGPSGCGKSTTLRMIAGLEEITSGELYIGDQLVNNISPKDRNIAMVFQSYALYPHMSVYKNMAFGLEVRKTAKDEIKRRVNEAARVLGIEDLLKRKPKALSGGQRQRVALGRAMVRNPAVFLLDEPLSNLDAKLRASMRTELIKLHQELATTFIYVTHDQIEALTMGDRIVVMKDGIVHQVDTPLNLYNKPRNVFVAGFIGTPQMNFLRGTLRREDERWYILVNGHKLIVDGKKTTPDMEKYIDQEVIMGVRPGHITDDRHFIESHPHSVVEATVVVREMMGNEAYLYLDFEGSQITACVPPNTQSKANDRISIGIDMGKILLFDSDTEKTIMF